MKKLWAIVLLLAMLLLTGCTAQEQPKNVVDVFNYADIKDQVETMELSNGIGDRIEPILVDLSEVDAWSRNYKVEGRQYGVILVVEVTEQSRNILFTENSYRSKGAPTVLKTDEIYADITDPYVVHGESFVKTPVVIKEILYQDDEGNLQEGQKIDVGERYYIVDDRLPNIRNLPNTTAYGKCSYGDAEWMALETGETYILFGSYATPKEKNGEKTLTSDTVWTKFYGVYCLSDPDKQAGTLKDAATFAEGIAYLKANYDLAKYGLK